MTRFSTFCSIICFSILSFISCNPVENSPAEIKITLPDEQIISESEGGNLTIGYNILNPRDGGRLSLEIPEGNDWISVYVIDEEFKTVTVTIAENMETESRSETLTFIYTYDKDSVTAQINIVQNECVYDYIGEGRNAASYFYGRGQLTDPDLNLYYLFISTTVSLEQYTKIYYFALAHSTETEDMLPLPGTYTMVPLGTETDFCFDDYNTYAQFVGGDIENLTDLKDVNFEGGSGTVVVERDGSIYTIKANVIDDKGRKHKLTYTGEL